MIIALGARFSDNNAGNWRKNAIYDQDETKIIQVDLAIEEIGRNYDVALGLTADAGGFLDDLAAELADTTLDIFTTSDAPVLEALGLFRRVVSA